jgi:hypothetical protein
MAVGGDILEIKWQHPTLGSGVFFPKANEDSTFGLGGFTSNDDQSMIDGGGNMIDQITRKRWFVEIVCSWDQVLNNELLSAQNLQKDPVLANYTISHVSGAVWQGTGKPVGDVQGNGNQATFTLKISGGNLLRKI